MTIEICCAVSPPIKCRDLRTACNRLDELKRRPKGYRYWRPVYWLRDTDARKSYETTRPGKRLAGKVFVRAGFLYTHGVRGEVGGRS